MTGCTAPWASPGTSGSRPVAAGCWSATPDISRDPAPAQGISDSLRQVDRLAPAILAGFARGGDAIDLETDRWWHWRDDDAYEKYWFAQDLGRGGTVPLVFVEMVRRLCEQGRF